MRQSQEPSIWPQRGTALALTLGFLLVLTYASTLIGPIGVNYVPRDPRDALDAFLTMRFVPHGSDQQADWMGNLLMLVPYGFLVTASVWPRRIGWLRPPAFVLALLLCVATVLAVKYLQLFFPPRTVTLNYVLAQSVGSLIGCTGFVVWHQRIAPALLRRPDPVRALVIALRLYLLALSVFLLMPLDFALTLPDLAEQWHRLPDTLTAIPGDGRPRTVRVLLVAATILAFVPVGVLLTFVRDRHARAWRPDRLSAWRVRRGLWSVAIRGLLLCTVLFALAALVLGASPTGIAILYRTLGIVLGAASLRWLMRQDLTRVRAWAAAAAPWLILPYLLALALANQVVSTEWRSWERALAETAPLGWLPLFDYYIVTKAEAAKNLVGHVVMYVPVGVAVWLRGPRRGRAALAFVLGSALSLAVETGRYLRPGLEGDINAVAVGGFAAMLTLPALDLAWSLLTEMVRQADANGRPSRQSAPPPVALRAHGEVETY